MYGAGAMPGRLSLVSCSMVIEIRPARLFCVESGPLFVSGAILTRRVSPASPAIAARPSLDAVGEALASDHRSTYIEPNVYRIDSSR